MNLAAVFSDHMVLQRNKELAFFGECDGGKVEIELAGKKVEKICENGKFNVKFPPLSAGGPYELSIKNNEETIVFKDVMIGEVWFAGGQSNMELMLVNSFEGEKELAKIEDKNVRYYQVPKKSYECEELWEEEKNSSWVCPSAEASKEWSAVAYYYAKKLSEELRVTVGIIGCNWGGTSASAWMSREKLLESKKTESYIIEYDEIVKNQNFEDYVKEREEYIVYQTAFEEKVSHYYQTAENPKWEEAIELFGENKYPGPMGPYSEFRPSGLYEIMLKKVCPYTIAGFIYYQGEEDDHKPETYFELLRAMIENWRQDWNDESLPCLLVQLPVFQNDGEPDYKNWPLIREAQMRIFKTQKNTGIAVILENGEYGNIHPTKKEVVGNRLALQSLYLVYGKIDKKQAFGPIYEKSHRENNELILSFEYCEDGFATDGDAVGFEIAGDDKKYVKADYKIDGNNIILWSTKISEPVYARYCWTNYQKIGIFGKNGIPLAPFRTSMLDGSKPCGSRLSNEGVM